MSTDETDSIRDNTQSILEQIKKGLGWSNDRLAMETGLSVLPIWRYMQGQRPAYAQAKIIQALLARLVAEGAIEGDEDDD